MLSIDRLTVGYGSHAVVSGLDLELAPGQVHGLVGRNGAGKTTLLETIYGFIRARAGTIRLDGKRPSAREIAYLPTENYFYSKITGREYLQFFQLRAPGFDPDAWGAIFELPLDRYVDGYSAGMKKKLALLGTLSLGRSVVLLDEPMNGLDLESNLILNRLLRNLSDAGRTVLVTSHVLESLTRACDRIHVLEGGRISHTVPQSRFAELEGHLLTKESEAKLEHVRSLMSQARSA
jgi:ABC-2 type transport system ATP-binding protein